MCMKEFGQKFVCKDLKIRCYYIISDKFNLFPHLSQSRKGKFSVLLLLFIYLLSNVRKIAVK